MRKLKITLLIVILCVIIAFIGNKLFPYILMDFTKFDPETWDKHVGQRYKMIDDFEAQYPIDTLTRETVKGLLGEKGLGETEYSLTYMVGKEFASIYYVYYSIGLDRQGNCTGSEKYYD